MENFDEIKIPWYGWKIVGRLGRGTFGNVYEIEREFPAFVEKAAMKVISIPRDESVYDAILSDSGYNESAAQKRIEDALERVSREYGVMLKLRGVTNIVRCDDFMYTEKADGKGYNVFIRMELLNSLQRELKERRKDNNAFSEEEIIKLGMDICRALVVCERNNITHRDIKPANVMVSDAGEHKLGDFGTARSFDHSTLATYTGTETYMAPEVYKHQTYIGRKADIYSLGLMLYWLANNYTRPFIDLDRIPTADERAYSEHRRVTGEPLPAPCNAGPALSHVILKACAYRSEDRYETAREMLEDLEKLKKGEAPVAAPASTKDDEIEALKRRLADLIGTTEEIPAAGDTRTEALIKRNTFDWGDVIDEPRKKTASDVRTPREVSVADEENVDIDYYSSLTISRIVDEDSYPDYTVYVQEDAGKMETEPVREVYVENDLEDDLEEAKRIDKYYDLYRKNEEFQRLLDEEYSKLQAAISKNQESAQKEP